MFKLGISEYIFRPIRLLIMKTRTDIGLFLLQLYRGKVFTTLEQEILKLSYSDLEFLIDKFNGIGESELAQMLFDRKLIFSGKI